jgi:DNA-directed RNA polymerase subunit M/transcription elongation factor TFIIS
MYLFRNLAPYLPNKYADELDELLDAKYTNATLRDDKRCEILYMLENRSHDTVLCASSDFLCETSVSLNKYEEKEIKDEDKDQDILIDLINTKLSMMGSSSLKCERCGSSEIKWHTFQTRSADEPVTVFCQCTKCNSRWNK